MNHELIAPALPQRPITILIATVGNEHGATLADWLFAAAQHCDYPVQCTPNPGVSPRTGSRTIYVEIYPVPHAQLGGSMPVMALMPKPGMVDLVVATELAEAGRALQNAYVDVERTTLVASTHRIYTVPEKGIPGDGRADDDSVLVALLASSQNAVLFDMAQVAQENSCLIDAVLFGALAVSGAVPLTHESCEHAIRSSPIAVAANISGFTAGYDYSRGQSRVSAFAAQVQSASTLVERVHQRFPEQTFSVLDTGVTRMIDYQDAAYATLYLDRLEGILALDREAGGAATGYQLTLEAGRQLAVWMSFEDVAVVARDMKLGRKAQHSARDLAEQSLIERWLGAVKRLGFAVQDVELALEIVKCARVVTGCGETRRSGIQQFETLFDKIIESGTESDPKKLSAAIRRARTAALSDPDAELVSQKLMKSDPGKPIFWMSRAMPEKAGGNSGTKPVEKQMG